MPKCFRLGINHTREVVWKSFAPAKAGEAGTFAARAWLDREFPDWREKGVLPGLLRIAECAYAAGCQACKESKKESKNVSVAQKREIADKVQQILRETNHPESPKHEIQFLLHVVGAEGWSWADIRNNGAVTEPEVNPWNELQARTEQESK